MRPMSLQRQSSARIHQFPRASVVCCNHQRPHLARSRGPELSAPSFNLPNGLVLRHFTFNELNFLYREVFEDRVYLRHGVTLSPGDTVVDVGANTGLFTLLARQLVGPGGRVVALEPLGHTFALLEANVAAHAEWCGARGVEVCEPTLLNCGAGARGQRTATFTTYSDSASGWSTMYPDDGEVRANMTAYIANLLEPREGAGGRGEAVGLTPPGTQETGASSGTARPGDAPGGEGKGGSGGSGTEAAAAAGRQSAVPEPVLAQAARAMWRGLPPLRPLLRSAASLYVEAMLRGQQRWPCALASLSEVVRGQGLRRVDLLKIDVERAELDVLSGIDPDDWRLVEQVVVEVHDLDGRLQTVRGLLAAKGFSRVVSEQDGRLVGSSLHVLYAVR